VRQVCVEKASVSEPLMTCRKLQDESETGAEGVSRDESGSYLFTGQALSGIKVARARCRLLHGT
jgi:hypothetical protein